MSTITLGQATEYPQEYAPGVLCAVPRSNGRAALGLGAALPFRGVDIWTAWELSWLEPGGKPVVATAEIRVPADSPDLVESKSLKLYLGSFAMTRYPSPDEVVTLVEADLARAAGAPVGVKLRLGEGPAGVGTFSGTCIDGLDLPGTSPAVDRGLLATMGNETVEDSLHTHLLRSLCPVTGQPDIGSVLVHYRGPKIDPASLLAYVVSFRTHQDFHEACVERMFCDIRETCGTEALSVYARYTRRGGIDINPFRSDFEPDPGNLRLWRQ